MIRHVVLFKLRPELGPADVEKIMAGLNALKAVVPGMLNVSFGKDVSPEGLQRGHTHGFTVDFADTAARDAYLPHPDHQKLGAQIVAATQGGVDGITVLDWEA